MECGICSNNYTTGSHIPKILSCGHTFCHDCLMKMLKDNTINCANCRKDTAFPEGYSRLRAVEALITNFAIMEDASDDKKKGENFVSTKTIDQKEVFKMNCVPTQPAPKSSVRQIIPADDIIQPIPEYLEVPEETKANPAPAPAPARRFNNHECTCQLAAESTLYLLLFIFKVAAGCCLLTATGLFIAYLVLIGNTDSSYFIVSICFIITYFGVLGSIWLILITCNDCFCDDVNCIKSAYKLILIVSCFLHLGVCIYGTVLICQDDDKDYEDGLFCVTVITEIVSLISLGCLIVISSIFKLAECYSLSLEGNQKSQSRRSIRPINSY